MLLDENNMAVQSEEFLHENDYLKRPVARAAVQPEARSFEIPASIWISMAASYTAFFGGLIIGTGHDGTAIFMIVISMLYALVYFGTAFILNGVGAAGRKGLPSEWVGDKFQTHTGPLSFGSVYGQMLVVPIMIGVWGVAIAIIRFAIM